MNNLSILLICLFTNVSLIQGDAIDQISSKLASLEYKYGLVLEELKTIKGNMSKLSSSRFSLPCGENWLVFNDKKCIRFETKTYSKQESIKECLSHDPDSNLISLHSKADQEFIINLTSKYQNISDSIWLGMEFSGKSFEWEDKTTLDFQNWADDADRSGSNKCFGMVISKTVFEGKWRDDSCMHKKMLVCQKERPSFVNVLADLKNLTKFVDGNITDNLKEQNKKIQNIKTNPVPIGFIYVQFKDQAPPQSIWPGQSWTEISKDYAGHFFRAVGGESAPYGQIQPSSCPVIKTVNQFRQGSGMYAGTQNVNLGYDNSWSNSIFTGSSGKDDHDYYLRFLSSNDEVRPINQAVKIWKRTG